MKNFLMKISRIPELVIDFVNKLIEAAGNACSTITGAVGFFVSLLLILDFIVLGKIGFIKFMLARFKDIMLIVAEVATKGGWSLGVLLFLGLLAIAMFKKIDK